MNISDGLTFDDIMLIPRYSEVKSRSDIDTSVDLGKGVKLGVPIVSANMASITEEDMATCMANIGGLALIHRFCSIENQKKMFNQKDANNVGISIGVKKEDKRRAEILIKHGCKIICIDIAHGHSKMAGKMTEYIAKTYPEVLLIAGNVCTASGAEYLYNNGADVIKVGIGSGCHAAGTRILLSSGAYKNIEDISPGDRIINKNGEPKTVLKSFSSGIKKVVKLRNSIYYKPTYVTPDHEYWVGDLNTSSKKTLQSAGYAKLLDQRSKTVPKKSKYKWKKVGNLAQDCLLMPKNIKLELPEDFTIELKKRTTGNYLSGHQYDTDVILTPDYDLGYIFGTFLGDGCASCSEHNGSHTGSVGWYFTNTEKNNEIKIAQKLEQCIKNKFDRVLSIKARASIWSCMLYYKPFADFLYSWGKKHKKHLPNKYLINNKKYLQGISDGLIDSDGHIEKYGRKKVGNTSTLIIELFNVITYILTGVFPNNKKPIRGTAGGLKGCNLINCKPAYIASINTSAAKRLTKDYQASKLLEYEITGLHIPVYDLSIDCDTHSFIANNAIVHNSNCTTRIETGAGVPQMTALYDVFEASKNGNCRRFKIIADGGIRNAGDCVKSLVFSDAVMLGSVLAGTNECPGEIQNINGKSVKLYEGSSTFKSSHVEGIKRMVPIRGPVAPIITHLMEGITSGLSYQNASNLEELKNDVKFVRITNAGFTESSPHGT